MGKDIKETAGLVLGHSGMWRRLTTFSIASWCIPINCSWTSFWTSSMMLNAHSAMAYLCSMHCLHLFQCQMTWRPNDMIKLKGITWLSWYRGHLCQHFPCHDCFPPQIGGEGIFIHYILFIIYVTSFPHNNVTLLSQVGITSERTKEIPIVQELLQLLKGGCSSVG